MLHHYPVSSTHMHIHQNVDYIREYFCDALHHEDFVIDKTGVKTVEMIGAQFVADESLIFGGLNHDYIERELQWYKSMSLNVNDIPGKGPEIWKQVCDESGYIHSNYGWCEWSDKNGRQYVHVRD